MKADLSLTTFTIFIAAVLLILIFSPESEHKNTIEMPLKGGKEGEILINKDGKGVWTVPSNYICLDSNLLFNSRDYQVEISQDSFIFYDGKRKAFTLRWDHVKPLDSLIMLDNQ